MELLFSDFLAFLLEWSGYKTFYVFLHAWQDFVASKMENSSSWTVIIILPRESKSSFR